MILWLSVFSKEPQVPGQRSPDELVTYAAVRVGLFGEARLSASARRGRRRTEGEAPVWITALQQLAAAPPKASYEIPPREILELQDLCAKIQCGPLIIR